MDVQNKKYSEMPEGRGKNGSFWVPNIKKPDNNLCHYGITQPLFNHILIWRVGGTGMAHINKPF
jgi:hypothetical protein